MRTSAFVDGGSSHIRVPRQFLDAFEAVPFPHGHLTVNQNVIGVVDNPVHNGLGNCTAVRRLGTDASVPLARVVLRTENHRPVMAASLDQLQQVVGFLRRQRADEPLVQNQQAGFPVSLQRFLQFPGSVSQSQFLQQFRQTDVGAFLNFRQAAFPKAQARNVLPLPDAPFRMM